MLPFYPLSSTPVPISDSSGFLSSLLSQMPFFNSIRILLIPYGITPAWVSLTQLLSRFESSLHTETLQLVFSRRAQRFTLSSSHRLQTSLSLSGYTTFLPVSLLFLFHLTPPGDYTDLGSRVPPNMQI
ncbi:Protein of unknown function [Pyronema omphalodes CBS 100304]|uniref:Uncharacterized protein n=1 Tax=Pyronema omphalodes (strain CBS 100304) TaxID=1076935 RepID=U4LSM8_PYROM|nr:Protein of unknown function [Pyronema omphalodes CBS 100304]